MSLFPKIDALPEELHARLSADWDRLSTGAKNEIGKLADLAVEYERLAIAESERRIPGFLEKMNSAMAEKKMKAVRYLEWISGTKEDEVIMFPDY